MSAILPFVEDMQYRVRKRIVGNIVGVICFTVLYFLLPSSIYAYIGILGGIGVGFSAQYGWQTVFNTFGALAIAAESYGLKGAVSLRVIQNVFGVVFADIIKQDSKDALKNLRKLGIKETIMMTGARN